MEKNLLRQLVLAFYIPSLLISIAYGTLSPVLPLYADTLTDAYTLIGLLLAGTSIGLLIGDLLASWSLAHFGMRSTMLGGVLLGMVPLLLLFFMQGILLAVLMLIVSGVGQALYNIARHQYVTAAVSAHYRGRAIGLLGGVFRIGKFIGPLIGGWVGGTFGLRYGFLAFVFFSGVTLLFVWRFMPALKRETAAPGGKNRGQRHALTAVLRDQRQILLSAGTGQILAQLTRQGWLVLIPLYSAKVLELDVQTIGFVLGVGSAVDMLFFYASGIIMDRFGRKWAIVPSFILQGLSVALIPLTTSVAELAAIGELIGFANGLSSGTMMTIGSDFAPLELRGEFLSIWRLIGDAGAVAAPVMIGGIAQTLTLGSSALAIGGAGIGAALLFLLFVPETLRWQSAPDRRV